MLVKVGSYVGVGTSKSIEDVGFQPDVVIVRRAGTSAGVYRFSTFDATESKPFGNNAMTTDRITAFDALGFDVAGNTEVNGVGDTYYYFAAKCEAADSAVFSYTGDGTDNNSAGSFVFTPAFAAVAGDTTLRWWWRTEELAGDASQQHTLGATTNGIQALQAGSIQLGTTLYANTIVYHAWVFKEIPSVAMITEYTGDTVDGNTEPHTLGTTPVFALLQAQTSGADLVARFSGQAVDAAFDIADAASGELADLISDWDGTNVTLGADARVNAATVYTLVTFGTNTTPASSGNSNLLLLGVGT